MKIREGNSNSNFAHFSNFRVETFFVLRRPREEKRSAQSPFASGFFLVGEEKWIEWKKEKMFNSSPPLVISSLFCLKRKFFGVL
jgi:hypothetical protein